MVRAGCHDTFCLAQKPKIGWKVQIISRPAPLWVPSAMSAPTRRRVAALLDEGVEKIARSVGQDDKSRASNLKSRHRLEGSKVGIQLGLDFSLTVYRVHRAL